MYIHHFDINIIVTKMDIVIVNYLQNPLIKLSFAQGIEKMLTQFATSFRTLSHTGTHCAARAAPTNSTTNWKICAEEGIH